MPPAKILESSAASVAPVAEIDRARPVCDLVELTLALGVAGGLAAYTLAWGLFATHPEIGMDSRNALTIAGWTAPLMFLASLIYFAIRRRSTR